MSNVDITPPPGEWRSHFSWTGIIAGALAAAALASVFHAFGAAIGLAVSSAAPTWRDGSIGLWFLSGVYLLLVALASYGLGGYIAAHFTHRRPGVTVTNVEFRDGLEGLMAWALATVLTVLLLIAGAMALDRFAAPSAGPASSVAGESIIAYDLDRLFRSDTPHAGEEITYNRSEAARILLTASSNAGVAADDRTYLARLVAARTGLGEQDATARVDAAIAAADENIARGRIAGVLLAFMSAAAALLGGVAAWYAAVAGGKHRDENNVSLLWSSSRPTRMMHT